MFTGMMGLGASSCIEVPCTTCKPMNVGVICGSPRCHAEGRDVQTARNKAFERHGWVEVDKDRTVVILQDPASFQQALPRG